MNLWRGLSVRLIAESRISHDGMRHWFRDMGIPDAVDSFLSPPSQHTDASRLVAVAAKRCYLSFDTSRNKNLVKVRQDLADTVANVLAQGHGSVLEHATWTFAIEGISRVATAELNRHRVGLAISEGSLRFITESHGFMLANVPGIPEVVRAAMERHLLDAQARYDEIMDYMGATAPDASFALKKNAASMARRVLPMGVATGGVWTFNARALRHILEVRGSRHAEVEIRTLALEIALLMMKSEPLLFSDFDTTIDGTLVSEHRKV